MPSRAVSSAIWSNVLLAASFPFIVDSNFSNYFSRPEAAWGISLGDSSFRSFSSAARVPDQKSYICFPCAVIAEQPGQMRVFPRAALPESWF